jgi:cell division protein FtsZ
VLDEQMGEEVKITVIATGFRDQMPERRARMWSVEDAAVVSVPVVAPGNWMREPAPEPEPEAKPARFMSQEEDERSSASGESFFFASAAPGVATTVTVGASNQPQYEDSHSETASAPLPEDFATAFTDVPRGASEPPQSSTKAESAVFAEPSGIAERDLDVPTFMRRHKF